MDKKELWSKVLNYIEPLVTQPTYTSFVEPLKLRVVENSPDIAYIEAEKDFFTNIIKRRYLHLIEEAFKSVTGTEYRVIIKSSSEYEELADFAELNDEQAVIPKRSASVETSSIPAKKSNPESFNTYLIKEKIFNPEYTFDNFVVGESNRYAHATCLAVAKSPSDAYNPLFIYGKSGLGKTHLINAIGIMILEQNKDMRILYVSSETFTNDFIKALQDKKTREFKAKYRRADVLLIDDIQFLEGKESMQEEFFHTFNALHEANKQIIISSDRPPKMLTKLDERLRSRFGWNIVAPIQPPDYETRVAILMKKAENMNVDVDDDLYDIICLISQKITDNIRELEGAFNRIISFSELMNTKADLPFAKRILKDIIQNGGETVTPEKIKHEVAKYYDITVADMESSTRVNTIAFPRQVAMYLCRNNTDYSLKKIGNIFGDRHYSTVKHACEKIDDEIDTDKELQEAIKIIESKLEH